MMPLRIGADCAFFYSSFMEYFCYVTDFLTSKLYIFIWMTKINTDTSAFHYLHIFSSEMLAEKRK